MSDCDKHDNEDSRPYAHDCFECAVRDEMLSADLSFAAAYDEAGCDDDHEAIGRVITTILNHNGPHMTVHKNDDGSMVTLIRASSPMMSSCLASMDHDFRDYRRAAAIEIVNKRRAS